MKTPREKLMRRAQRVRAKLRKQANGRPRLSVVRSSKNIAAQVIDDEKDFRSSTPNGGTSDAAATIGKLIAERASKAGVEDVVFDRGGYMFHGRIKALADAAREGGLKF